MSIKQDLMYIGHRQGFDYQSRFVGRESVWGKCVRYILFVIFG